MEPYKAKMLPISYKLDKEMIKLLGQANDKYGQYKSLLKMLSLFKQSADGIMYK